MFFHIRPLLQPAQCHCLWFYFSKFVSWVSYIFLKIWDLFFLSLNQTGLNLSKSHILIISIRHIRVYKSVGHMHRLSTQLAPRSVTHYHVSWNRSVPAGRSCTLIWEQAKKGCMAGSKSVGWTKTHRRAGNPNASVSTAARRPRDPRCSSVPLEREKKYD